MSFSMDALPEAFALAAWQRIAREIEASELEASVKSQLVAQVQSLPAKGLEGVVTGLAREGLARLPNAIQWLQTSLPVGPW